MNKTGRNDPCPCGSGQKYKRCCIEQDATTERLEREDANAVIQAKVERVQQMFKDEDANAAP